MWPLAQHCRFLLNSGNAVVISNIYITLVSGLFEAKVLSNTGQSH